MGDLYVRLRDAIRDGRPVALATIVEGPGTGRKLVVFPPKDSEQNLGDLGDSGLERVVTRDASGELEAGRSVIRHYGPHGEARETDVAVFIESFAPPPRMIIFGAVDFTASLVQVAKILGYYAIVCDARAVFATKARFPLADEVIVDWPHRHLEKVGPSLTRRDAICVLTHDHKFDVPAVIAALKTEAGYIGCMGSRRTHRARLERLRGEGVEEDALARVMSPLGIDIGARTPAETAISICAEIIATTVEKPVPSLRDTTGPIH